MRKEITYRQKQDDIIKKIKSNMLKSEQLHRMMTLTRQKVESKKVEAKNINDDLSVAGLECEENVYESRPETP